MSRFFVEQDLVVHSTMLLLFMVLCQKKGMFLRLQVARRNNSFIIRWVHCVLRWCEDFTNGFPDEKISQMVSQDDEKDFNNIYGRILCSFGQRRIHLTGKGKTSAVLPVLQYSQVAGSSFLTLTTSMGYELQHISAPYQSRFLTNFKTPTHWCQASDENFRWSKLLVPDSPGAWSIFMV